MVVVGMALRDFFFYGLVFIRIQSKVGSKNLWEQGRVVHTMTPHLECGIRKVRSSSSFSAM